MPHEQWAQGQRTPLCNGCDGTFGRCRFCRDETAEQDEFWADQFDSQSELSEAEEESEVEMRPVFGPEPPPGLIEALQEQERQAAAAREEGAAAAGPKEEMASVAGRPTRAQEGST